jgi:hypothetical protein
MLRAPLSSYHEEKPERSLGRWALSIGGIALCLAIGFGILQMSPNSFGWLTQSLSEAGAFVRNAVSSLGNSTGMKSDSDPVNSSLDVQAAELPSTGPGKSAASNNGAETYSVVAQSGETLSQIALRTLGISDAETVEQIRKLNPAVADSDQLKAGQRIRFPRIFVSGVATNKNSSAAGKN